MGNYMSDSDCMIIDDDCYECLESNIKIKLLEDELQQLKLLLELKQKAIDLLENQIYLLEKYK